MPTLADSLVSSTARPLNVRMRPDLVVRETRYQGTPYWVVKDPVGLNYFRFQEEEYNILQWLDGQTSLDELKRRFERQFAPQKIGLDELGRLIGTLHRSNLVIADLPGQGPQLIKRRREKRRQKLLGTLTNILAIRFKGIDPERILTGMLPYTRWFFSKWTATFCILFGLSALLLVAVQFDVFQAKLPSFHQFFAAENWIWLAVAMGVTKVIHEFGHGLSCKYFGGECHEMGAMLLVFTPCLYCNVSDSWMLPNKWQRAFIGAAGMYVELVLASVATYVWWFSDPGSIVNQLALSTMFVCSVSTLMFNANPLMRYDGYYILSDITEIPNLRQKASTILSRKLGKWCLGLKEPDDPFLPERNQAFFAIYSVASAVYMWLVTFSILYFLYKVLEPYRLQIIGQILAGFSLVSLVGMPLYKLGRFFYMPGRIDQVKKPRLFATLGVLTLVAAAIVFIPLPYRIVTPMEVRARNPDTVYVSVPGQITEILVRPGDTVVAGQKIAQLQNLDLEKKIVDLQSRREQLLARRESLEEQRLIPGADRIDPVGPTVSLLDAVTKQLSTAIEEKGRLTLIAPKDGTVFVPESRPEKPENDIQLPAWSGTPLDRVNLGATLEKGEFCLIGNPHLMNAVVVVDQSDIDFVQPNQAVDVKIDVLPHETFSTKVEFVSPEPMEFMSKQLSNKGYGEVETVTDESGMEKPINTMYPVEAILEDAEGIVRPGMRGRAKIHAGYQTLGQRGWRWLKKTFNFDL